MNNKKRTVILTVSAALFVVLALYIGSVAPSREIAWVMGILIFTVYLFVFEVAPIDVAAMFCCMLFFRSMKVQTLAHFKLAGRSLVTQANRSEQSLRHHGFSQGF